MKRRGVWIIGSAVVLTAALTWFCIQVGLPGRKRPAVQVTSSPEIARIQTDLDSIVSNYRKIIILLEDEQSLDPPQAARANLIGKDLYYRNQKLVSGLMEKLTAETNSIGQGSFTALPETTIHFLNRLENLPDWHDADKLVFFDVVEELIETTAKLPESFRPRADLLQRLNDDLKALKEIQALYNKELDKIFGRFEARGMVVHREAWEKYVAYLKTKYTREDIFKEYSRIIPEEKAGRPVDRGRADAPVDEFAAKHLLLTFDDGPHHRYTPRIMEILKEHGVKAVFFELGSNIGSIRADNTIQRTKASKVSEDVVKSGFFLANHSYSHSFLPKLSEKDLAKEIDQTNRLLESITNDKVAFFRPPYGAQDEKVLKTLKSYHLKSMLWQIDSKDWADPVPKSIADRVVREVNRSKKGIILFHDINPRTVEALPHDSQSPQE